MWTRCTTGQMPEWTNNPRSVGKIVDRMRVEFLLLARQVRVGALVAVWRHFVGVLRQKYQLEEEDRQEDKCKGQRNRAVT